MPPKRGAAGADADVPAKKQKTRAKAPKAESTALVTIDPYTPTDIYMLIDRGTGKVIYIGQSIDTQRRWSEHARKVQAVTDSRLKRYLQQKQRGIDLIEIKRVPELPKGVAQMHADAFEAVLISDAFYGTAHDCCTNPDGCNMNGGNKADTVDVAEITRQLAEGYVWPEPAKAQVAARQAASAALQDARFQEAVLTDLDARANDDPEHPIEGLADALGEARLVLGRMQGDGLYEHVRDVVLPAYENLQPFVNISRDGLAAELNHIKDRAKEADERLSKEIVCELAALRHEHPKKPQTDTEPKVEFPYTAKAAVHKLRVVLGLVGRFAEDKLDLTSTTMRNWVAIRKWSSEHKGKVPSAKATRRRRRPNETEADQVEEKRLAGMIGRWRSPFDERHRKITGRPEEASVYVLVRDFPVLLETIMPKDEKDANTAERDATCVDLLKRGMAPARELKAYPNESEAEGLMPVSIKNTDMTTKTFKNAIHVISHYVNGQNASLADTLRAAADDSTKLTRARVERLVALNDLKRKECAAEKGASASADAPELDASDSEGDGEDQ